MSQTLERLARQCSGLLFATQVAEYLSSMQAEGFSNRTICRRLYVLVAFGRYLTSKGVQMLEQIVDFAEPFVGAWVSKSIRLDRTGNPVRLASEVGVDVRLFLRHLIATRHLQSQTDTGTEFVPIFQISLVRFVESLLGERALAPTTVRGYDAFARKFLSHVESMGIEDWSAIDPAVIDSFVVVQARTVGRRGMRVVCAALRNLLRFARMEGHDLVPRLENFLWPRVYQHEDLPRFLRGEQVRAVLEAVDRTGPPGIRDYAILLLLVMYGMRAAEVARLTLEDVNWETEKVRLRNRKSGRTDWLPLSRPVGEALLDYLKVRPKVAHRQIFLTLRAPLRPFRTGAPVSLLAGKRLRAAEIKLPRLGAHLFRHTTAWRLLTEGFSFKAIGDYLGHSAASSTSIYLKIDLVGLSEVALNDGEELV